MTDVFLERSLNPPRAMRELVAMARAPVDCFALHRVIWCESLLGTDGRQRVARMVCRFQSPDVESARIALRQAGADVRVLWEGTVHEAPTRQAGAPDGANVLVERSFAAPVTVAQIQALEDAGAGCLRSHRVRFVRTYFSRDGRRMLCLYHAPDTESVRLAQRQAGMPLERVWRFRPVRADSA